MSVFVGLDCGGSSTRLLAVDEDGTPVAQGQAGAANLVSTPITKLRNSLASAAASCPAPDFVCGCFAGLISEEIRRDAEHFLLEIFPNAQVRGEPDYAAALYASPTGTDICVIAGTGSLVCSRQNASIVKSGGRGYLLGDAGSGYQYGLDAVNHYIDDPDGSSDQMRQAIFDVMGTDDPSKIVSHIYRSPSPATLLAKLLRVLSQDAKANEPYALESVDTNTDRLAKIVAQHAGKYHPNQGMLGVSLTGGVWKSAAIFRERFEAHLRRHLPNQQLQIERLNRPPLYGAVELAKEMSHRN